ncbi:TetR/AcrR family transcriptional regulator [Gephyromycinifex aptenodytis]|uniref:TetR/AcrR family transcriptional regulator n=1 Tax=Gephyromycinifex aptenodytis TaxID=2716227 RepID=UPI001445ABB2|nr:TetR/AcrR family transcriptional regulator [Gephyromycinifex aptenodytis]
MGRSSRPIHPDELAELLDVAASAFERCGYAAASLSDVLAEADIPKKSFSESIGEKKDLFERVLADRLRALQEQVILPDPALLDDTTFWPTIRRVVENVDSAARRDPRTVQAGRLAHLSDAPRVPALEEMQSTLRGWLHAILERGRELDCVDAHLPVELQRSLTIAVMVEVDQWVQREEANQGDPELADELLRRLLSA